MLKFDFKTISILILAGFWIPFVSVSCNSHSINGGRQINRDQVSNDTFKIQLRIEMISIKELRNRFPEMKIVSDYSGFVLFGFRDTTFYPTGTTIKYVSISAEKELYIMEKESYMTFYLVEGPNIFNDSSLISDSLSCYKKGEDIFIESYFFIVRPRVEIISINQNNEFNFSEYSARLQSY